MLTAAALLWSAPVAHAADPVAEYAHRRLVCWTKTRYSSTTTIGDDGNLYTSGGEYTSWGVRDGRGQSVPTTTFASLVGDSHLVPELEAEAASTRKRGMTVLLAGAAGAGVGLGGMVLGGRTGTYPVLMGGSLLLAGGTTAASFGLSSAVRARAPLEHVPLAYDAGLARQRCQQYNDGLRRELGLTPSQTQAIDTAWTFAPQHHPLVVRPQLSVASVGLTGTF